MRKPAILTMIAAVLTTSATPALPRASAPRIALWRLDCGRLGKLNIPDSCYLIRHGSTYLLWDAGLNPVLANKPDQQVGGHAVAMGDALPQQLKKLGLAPDDIAIVAISHAHFDHVDGALSFPHARLLIGRKDYEALTTHPATLTTHPLDLLEGLSPWITGDSTKDLVDGDRDIFGDGSVTMLDTPGHTPGHHSLLVKLRHTGPVLLTGDLYHSADEYQHGAAIKNVNDPVAIAASDRRIKALVASDHPVVVIAHEPQDIDKLPIYPKSAD